MQSLVSSHTWVEERQREASEQRKKPWSVEQGREVLVKLGQETSSLESGQSGEPSHFQLEGGVARE